MQLQMGDIPEPDWTDSNDGSEFDADSSIVRRAIEVVRNEFETRTWDAFWAVTIEQRAPHDVATQLGVSPGAIYQAKSRVIRRLRRELDGRLG